MVWVDGVPIERSLFESRMKTTNVMSQGLSGEEKEATIAKAQEEVLNTLIMEQACLNEAEKRGIRLEGAVLEDADQRYDRMILSVESYIKASYPNLSPEEMDAQVDSMLKLIGASRESYRAYAERAALLAALENDWIFSIPDPSEAKIQERYDQMIAEQKELFDKDENAFESAMLNHEVVVYRPVDLKLIRKAEFLFSDEIIKFIRESRQYSSSLADSQVMEQYQVLADEVEPIYEALISGETTFTDVLEELNPGSSGEVNYFNPLSTRFSADYYDRANAFKTVGEISTAYLIANGYAVLEYYGDLPACESVPLEEVREAIIGEINGEISDRFIADRMKELVDAAEIVYAEGME